MQNIHPALPIALELLASTAHQRIPRHMQRLPTANSGPSRCSRGSASHDSDRASAGTGGGGASSVRSVVITPLPPCGRGGVTRENKSLVELNKNVRSTRASARGERARARPIPPFRSSRCHTAWDIIADACMSQFVSPSQSSASQLHVLTEACSSRSLKLDGGG
ncbi:hypothetical protein PYCCODRAFT_12830 [Trametes coccinea BRFM310]|uniref:Uncharacterized protein n=1 Tax=Trametes coccinea (strain BRFM310) TaxID=1353009 RepID=A0A1Y2J4U7_TRAC3|nr:hypothetical protein PYCCODRAFT_12830 [Trametes coccinea BRFM310]